MQQALTRNRLYILFLPFKHSRSSSLQTFLSILAIAIFNYFYLIVTSKHIFYISGNQVVYLFHVAPVRNHDVHEDFFQSPDMISQVGRGSRCGYQEGE
jgi:hypothetical protein